MVSGGTFLEKGQVNTSVPVVVIAPGYHGHAIARSLGRLISALQRHDHATGERTSSGILQRLLLSRRSSGCFNLVKRLDHVQFSSLLMTIAASSWRTMQRR